MTISTRVRRAKSLQAKPAVTLAPIEKHKNPGDVPALMTRVRSREMPAIEVAPFHLYASPPRKEDGDLSRHIVLLSRYNVPTPSDLDDAFGTALGCYLRDQPSTPRTLEEEAISSMCPTILESLHDPSSAHRQWLRRNMTSGSFDRRHVLRVEYFTMPTLTLASDRSNSTRLLDRLARSPDAWCAEQDYLIAEDELPWRWDIHASASPPERATAWHDSVGERVYHLLQAQRDLGGIPNLTTYHVSRRLHWLLLTEARRCDWYRG